MSSSNASSPTDQSGTTPTLNNLLNKPMSEPSSDSQPSQSSSSAQESSMQNGALGGSEGQGTAPVPEWPGPPPGQGQVPPQMPPTPMMPHHQQPHGPGAEQTMNAQPMPPSFPPGYHQQWGPPRPGMPSGYPQYPGSFPPPPGAGYQYPPGLMRPPPQGDFVRMPPGTTPLEWSAMQKKIAESQQNPGTPVSVPAPSPAASSIADESMDDKSRMDSPSWPVPGPHAQGQRTPIPGPGVGMPPGMGPPPGVMMHAQHPQMHPGVMPQGPAPSGPRKETIVDKLVGPPSLANPPRVMPERRHFFERLVNFCESHGEPITMVPQVSKQNVDLHRLYISVRNRGGFEQVTKDKAWKSICQEANPDISESSAAGYQLRRHYQKYLLMLECVETGKNAEDAVAFAEKLKRVRKKDSGAAANAAAANAQQPPPPPASAVPGFPPGSAGGTASPSTSRLAAATATWYPQQPQHGSGYLSSPAAATSSASAHMAPRGTAVADPYAAYRAHSGRGTSSSTAPYPYPPNYYVQQSRDMYYRSRGMGIPVPDWRTGYGAPMGQMPPGGPQGYPPPGDPQAQHYAQQQQMQQYYGYPPGSAPPGSYPPGHYPPRIPPGAPGPSGAMPPGHMQMRPPMAQPPPQAPHQMPPQHQQQQQHHQQHHPQQAEAETSQGQSSLQVPGQNLQPATPGSQVGPASVQPPTPQTTLQVDQSGSQSGSRAPSAGPPPGAATPDSCSRLSGGGDSADRPESRAAATPGASTSATPQPPSVPSSVSSAPAPPVSGMMPPPHMQMPSTSLATSVQTPQGPPGAGGSMYYGQPPPMYPNGHGRPSGYPGYGPPPPGPGYHPGAAGGAPPSSHMHPQYQPPPNHPSHPAHPQHQQYMQQVWQSRGYPQGPGGPPQMPNQMPPRGYGYPPGPPRLAAPQAPAQGAPSPGANKMRYPGQPAAQSTPQPAAPPPQPAHFPPTSTPTRAAGTTATPAQYPTPQPQPPAPSVPSVSASSATVPFPHSHSFPSGSVEATAISQSRRKRPLARDLVNATPRRLIMSLRSGMETEAIWAMNALNVLLYDDSNPHPSLSQMPGLLNVLVEHFWATLSVLYPEEFSLPQRNSKFIHSDDECNVDLDSILCSKERTEMAPFVTSRNEKKQNPKLSRTGRKVQYQNVPPPAKLKRFLTSVKDQIEDESLSASYVEKRIALGLGGGLAERVADRLRADIKRQELLPKPQFSAHQDEGFWDNAEEEEKPSVSVKVEIKEDDKPVPKILLCRHASSEELVEGPNEWELPTPKQTALTERNEGFHRLAMRVLSLSNILRGFAFLPGTEALLCKHHGLLFLVGRFLSLLADERRVKRSKPKLIDLDAPAPSFLEPEAFHTERKKMLSILDNDDYLVLLKDQTSAQLRDDALTMLCHMSASLDLSEAPSEISYPIYDGLLRWCVSSVPEATDVLPNAQMSMRNYCLEIICKMVVIERNVDMFLSTGAWPRIERFIVALAKMLSMSEETQNREFAIVILNACCNASEAVSYVAAMEAPAITNLIAFIEASDQNMHQVMSAHGMPALRDNPEMMGTSVGMLRRAASLLRLLIKVPEAFKIYLKHQQRLLQFTMSQLMDSRVAGMIADTLFEMQDAAGPCMPDRPVLKFEPCSSKHNGDIKVKKMEIQQVEEVSTEKAETPMEETLEEVKRVNGNAHSPQRAAKRPHFDEDEPTSKRSCLENGFGEKKNGKLETPSIQKLKESSRQETNSMAVVA